MNRIFDLQLHLSSGCILCSFYIVLFDWEQYLLHPVVLLWLNCFEYIGSPCWRIISFALKFNFVDVVVYSNHSMLVWGLYTLQCALNNYFFSNGLIWYNEGCHCNLNLLVEDLYNLIRIIVSLESIFNRVDIPSNVSWEKEPTTNMIIDLDCYEYHKYLSIFKIKKWCLLKYVCEYFRTILDMFFEL